MWNRDLGFLVVVDDAGKPVGVITDRDAAMAACTRGVRMDDLAVETVMTRQVWPCRAQDSIEGALKVMAGKLVRRLPVVAEDGKLVGIITLGDVARAVLEIADGGQREAGLAETVSALGRITAPARSSQPA
jgi:CBS domain-containing protein